MKIPPVCRLGAFAAPLLLYHLPLNTCAVAHAATQQPEDGRPLLLHSLLGPSSLHWRHGGEGSREPQEAAAASSLPHIQLARAAETDEPHERNGNLRGDNEEGEVEEGRESEAEVEPEEKEERQEITENDDADGADDADDDADGQDKEKPPRGKPGEKFRDEYKPSDFLIDSADLKFVLCEADTEVTAEIKLARKEGTSPMDLILNGEDLKLNSISVDGNELSEIKEPQEEKGEDEGNEKGYYFLKDGSLVITKAALPEEAGKEFVVKTQVVIHPKENLKLSGLYVSGDLLVTQNEAEGFRRITYFIDRPDVLAKYTVRLEADKSKYPVLLSNGNKTSEGAVEGSEQNHFVEFHDPHPKPSYLFALIAGKLESITDEFTTKSGNKVAIALYSEPEQVDKLHWALESVKKAMKWDEEAFGREYDLDEFNIACVSDFNAGAMENKGLNIFNCALLLADPKTTTDAEYERVLSVIGHEYFHNWSGDRVTLRDWFQLTLKEGLTVFREQSFMASVASPAVQRVQDVAMMISAQFAEDQGPMAHPIRPESYLAMDNFYTTTVYEKGAEVVRMYQTILGKDLFRKGMDLYFERNDGHAVTCDDFRKAMADASGRDFSQFERWYSQAGTPHLEVVEAFYDKDNEAYEITFKQYTPPTPGQPEKKPQFIPIKFGLLSKATQQDLLDPAMVLEMTEEQQTFRIPDVKEDCVPSILRDFSAPVKLVYPGQTMEELSFLMAFDKDPVNKWQAAQALVSAIILDRARQAAADSEAKFDKIPNPYILGLGEALQQDVDNALKALALAMPNPAAVIRELKPIDPDALHKAMRSVAIEVSEALEPQLLKLYEELTLPEGEEDKLTPEDASRRRLRNAVLRLLSEKRDRPAAERAYAHFEKAGCMTDKYAALTVLANMEHEERERAFSRFFDDANGDALVLDKWFKAQALSDLPDQVERVEELQNHETFSFTNPNRLRALLLTFAASNLVHFHRLDGKGYKLLADAILKVDKFNPYSASRAAKVFLSWRDYEERRQQLMREQLERILEEPSLSKNVREVVLKALDSESQKTQ